MEYIETTHGATNVYVDGAKTVRKCVQLDLIQEMTVTEILFWIDKTGIGSLLGIRKT